MKKYFLLALALGLSTAQTTAMYRMPLRNFATKTVKTQKPQRPKEMSTALKITAGMALGFNAAALATHQCPFLLLVKPGARDYLSKEHTTTLELGTIAGATLAAGIWGTGISVALVAANKHKKFIADHIKALEVNNIVPSEISTSENNQHGRNHNEK